MLGLSLLYRYFDPLGLNQNKIIFHDFFELPKQNRISFQEFRIKFLEPGLVHHIDVSKKNVAKVYVKNSYSNQREDSGGKYQCYFKIGSVESFEFRLEEAQRVLGINPHDFVPVTYSYETKDFLLCMILFICFLHMVVINSKGISGLLNNMNGGQVIKADENDDNKVSND